MISFTNKVIILTGASEGIGRELALKLSNQNCNLVLAARSKSKLDEVAELVRLNNSNALPVICDITCESDCCNLIKITIAEFGGIDILINNVGVTSRSLIENTEIHVLKSLMEVNFWGAARLTKEALPFIKARKGMLIAISSVIGKVPIPGRSGYSTSKHALESYYETLRMELMEEEVDVLVIRPSYAKTNIRINAVTGNGDIQNYSTLDEEELISPAVVAEKIISAIRKKKNGYTLGKKMEGSWLILLYKLFPNFMSKIIFKKIKREAHSLFTINNL